MTTAMTLEAALAYAHLLALLSWTVFVGSQAALLRPEWLNAAALQRLVFVERITAVGALLTLATGLARLLWGMKGAGWYLGQPLMWAKLALFALMFVAGWRVGRQIHRWAAEQAASGALPAADAVHALRKRQMRAAHLMLVIPLAAVGLARGIGTV